jgi:deoxyribodipyrimidine photo-lyase
MKTIIVWFRNDLRIHDHPALIAAAQNAEQIVPVFIFNDRLLRGNHSSSNRNRFLIECLKDLKDSFKKTGADLALRSGEPQKVLIEICKEVSADAVYYTADYTPFSVKRDKRLKQSLEDNNIEFRSFPGRLCVSSLQKLQTKSGDPYKVFTPFWKQWGDVKRRELANTPVKLKLPVSVKLGALPNLETITKQADLSSNTIKGGESEGRTRLKSFLSTNLANYHQGNNDMASDSTSRLSPYLHFGCLSPREIETMLPYTKGARAWHRQLCWREFYNYIIFHYPDTNQEFQDKYRKLKWSQDEKLFSAWQEGKTGYPVVDAAMRQLKKEGWMHNRARLIVGSFLTKDLWLDWRLGESHFMHFLLDGDEANNNGNWQWIASVGVDPAPIYRRLYNPSLQQSNYDPSGEYVRRYLYELNDVPDEYLIEPWNMPSEVQEESKCIIGKDYPKPIVNHKQARQAALENYRSLNP